MFTLHFIIVLTAIFVLNLYLRLLSYLSSHFLFMFSLSRFCYSLTFCSIFLHILVFNYNIYVVLIFISIFILHIFSFSFSVFIFIFCFKFLSQFLSYVLFFFIYMSMSVPIFIYLSIKICLSCSFLSFYPYLFFQPLALLSTVLSWRQVTGFFRKERWKASTKCQFLLCRFFSGGWAASRLGSKKICHFSWPISTQLLGNTFYWLFKKIHRLFDAIGTPILSLSIRAKTAFYWSPMLLVIVESKYRPPSCQSLRHYKRSTNYSLAPFRRWDAKPVKDDHHSEQRNENNCTFRLQLMKRARTASMKSVIFGSGKAFKQSIFTAIGIFLALSFLLVKTATGYSLICPAKCFAGLSKSEVNKASEPQTVFNFPDA